MPPRNTKLEGPVRETTPQFLMAAQRLARCVKCPVRSVVPDGARVVLLPPKAPPPGTTQGIRSLRMHPIRGVGASLPHPSTFAGRRHPQTHPPWRVVAASARYIVQETPSFPGMFIFLCLRHPGGWFRRLRSESPSSPFPQPGSRCRWRIRSSISACWRSSSIS